jgi:hypothetical protein
MKTISKPKITRQSSTTTQGKRQEDTKPIPSDLLPPSGIIGGPSVILGDNAEADGNGNVSIGPGAFTKGDASIAIGSDAIANATRFDSNAQQNTAVGAASFVNGNKSTALGAFSKAQSDFCTALGAGASIAKDSNTSTAVGTDAIVNQRGGTAIGQASVTSGRAATALGVNSYAQGRRSIGLGVCSRALHDHSIAIGAGATTTKDNQMRIGYNGINPNKPAPFDETQPCFSLKPDGTPDVPPTLEEIVSTASFISENGNFEAPNGVMISQSFNKVSDKHAKDNIQDSKLGLDFVLNLYPKTYSYTNDPLHQTHLGLVAQDVEELISTTTTNFGGIHKNELGQYSLDYTELMGPIIKAIHELSAKVDKISKV